MLKKKTEKSAEKSDKVRILIASDVHGDAKVMKRLAERPRRKTWMLWS